jgi:hypothetical protein
MPIMIIQHRPAYRWITDYFGCNSAKIQVVMIDEVGLNKSPELDKYLLTNK